MLDTIFKEILPAAVETVGALIIAANSLAKALGNLLGGLAASLVQLAGGNFGAAWDTAKAAFSDSNKIIAESNTQIAQLMNRSNAAAPAIEKTAEATNRMAKAASAVAESGKKAADATKAWEKALKEWNEQMKLMDDARAHWLKAEQDKLDLIYKSIESEQKTIDGIRQTTEGYDKQAAALTYTTEELLKKEQARVIEIANNLRVMEGADRLVQAYDDQAAAIGRLIDANKSSEFKKSLADQEAEFKRTYDSISNTITDALMRGFESGKDWAKNFIQTLKNMFATLVLRPIIQAVINPVAGGITALLTGGLANASGGGSGGIGGLGNLASSASNLFSLGGSSLGTSVGMSSFGQWAGLSAAGLDTAGGLGLTSLGTTLAPVISALPWAALAAIAIPAIVKMFDKGPASRTATFSSGDLGNDPSRDAVFSGKSAFGNFGISKDFWLGPEYGEQFKPVIDAMTQLDNTIAKMVGGELTKSITDALEAHSITVGMGVEGTDINASGGPGAIFKDRYATALDAIHTGMGQMVRDFEGSGDALAEFVLTLVSFEQGATSATDALGEAQQKLIDAFAELNLAMPDSAAGFMDLVQGLDLSTQSGRDTLNMLIALQPAFTDVSNAIAGLKSSIQSSIDDIMGVPMGERAMRGLAGAIDAFVKDHDWAGPLREQLGDVGFAKNLSLMDTGGADFAAYAEKDAAGLAQINAILGIFSQTLTTTTEAVQTHANTITETAKAYDWTDRIAQAHIAVLRAQGKEAEALAAERALELAAMVDAPPVLIELTKELWGLQDAARESTATVSWLNQAHANANAGIGRSSALVQQIISDNGKAATSAAGVQRGAMVAILDGVNKAVEDAASALEKIRGEAGRLTDQADALKSYRDRCSRGRLASSGLAHDTAPHGGADERERRQCAGCRADVPGRINAGGAHLAGIQPRRGERGGQGVYAGNATARRRRGDDRQGRAASRGRDPAPGRRSRGASGRQCRPTN